MKKNLRGKIRDFMRSEEGKVGIKSPLTLGVATGSMLLAQVIVGTSHAGAGNACFVTAECDLAHEVCHNAKPELGIKGSCY